MKQWKWHTLKHTKCIIDFHMTRPSMVVWKTQMCLNQCYVCAMSPDNEVHGANMGPTSVLSAPDVPHVGPMNLAIREDSVYNPTTLYSVYIFLQLTDFAITERLAIASMGLTGLITSWSKDITEHYEHNDNMFFLLPFRSTNPLTKSIPQ